MTYIERDLLIDELKRYEMRRVSANDTHGASITREAIKTVARQPIVVGEWQDDVCSVCLNKTEGAMEKKYEWCPRCGAAMKEVE